jgi:prepilin-type N-terminal cleavage/methylation domain-containing protein
MLTPRTHGTLRACRQGFTFIEVVVALVILAVAVLGMGASAGMLSRYAGSTELRALAVQAVQDQISKVKVDPRYAQLDSLHEGTETDLEGLPGYTRVTEVEWVRETQSSGGVLDYKIVSVVVTGPGLDDAISRRLIVAAP